jgi:hypothetical protein
MSLPAEPLGLKQMDARLVDFGGHGAAVDGAGKLLPRTFGGLKEDSRAPAARSGRIWGAHRAQERQKLIDDLESALEVCPLGRRQVLLDCLLQIARQERPRPATRDRETGEWPTSRLMLCTYTGISKYFIYEDGELITLLARFLPQLDSLPGYEVTVSGTVIAAVNPLSAQVALALDALELGGGRLPRVGNRPSIALFCERMGFEYEDVEANHGAKRRISDAAKIPGALEEKSCDQVKRGSHDADYKRLQEGLQRLRKEGRPLPCRTDDPEALDWAALRRLLGLKSETLMFQLKAKALVSQHRSDYGLSAPVRQPIVLPTFSQFRDHVLKEYARGIISKQASCNRVSSLLRALKAHGLDLSSTFDKGLFDDVDALARLSAALAPALGVKSSSSHKSNLKALAATALEFDLEQDGLPLCGAEALGQAINESGLSHQELAKRTGIPAPVLRDVRMGKRQYPDRLLSNLAALEEQLSTEGKLALRLERDFSTKNIRPSPYYRSLSAHVRAALPPNAYRLSDAALRPRVADIEKNLLRQNRAYSKMLSHAGEIWSWIPGVPSEAPFLGEFALLRAHKTAAVPLDGCARRAKGLWAPSTADQMERALVRVFRYAHAPKSFGGLELKPEQLSMGLFLNWRFMAGYLDWSASLHSGVEHEGEFRGPKLTLHLVSLIDTIVGFFDANYGWLTQNPQLLLKSLQPIASTIPPLCALEELREKLFNDTEKLPVDLSPCAIRQLRQKNDAVGSIQRPISEAAVPAEADELVFDYRASTAVMPTEIVEEAKIDCRYACRRVWSHLRNLRGFLTHLTEVSRDPFEPIRFIVQSDQPLKYLADIIEAARNGLPDSRTSPVRHSLAVRDLLMFVLLVCTALRSENIRGLLWRPGGGGEIDFTANDDLQIRIPWRKFKNFGSKYLFGPTGMKVDYGRELRNWFGVKDLFDYYLCSCRDVLIGHFADSGRVSCDGRTSTDALFPAPGFRIMSEHQFGNVVRDITRKYHVMDPVTKVVRPGYMFFGPHAVRDIIATHIIKNMLEYGELRWEFAADLLQTSIEMVKTRYAFNEVHKRLAKTDRLFDEAAKDFTLRALG